MYARRLAMSDGPENRCVRMMRSGSGDGRVSVSKLRPIRVFRRVVYRVKRLTLAHRLSCLTLIVVGSVVGKLEI